MFYTEYMLLCWMRDDSRPDPPRGESEKKLTGLKTRTTGNGTNARSVVAADNDDDGPSFIYLNALDAAVPQEHGRGGWVPAQMFSPLSIVVIVRLTAPSRPDTQFDPGGQVDDDQSFFQLAVFFVWCARSTGVREDEQDENKGQVKTPDGLLIRQQQQASVWCFFFLCVLRQAAVRHVSCPVES